MARGEQGAVGRGAGLAIAAAFAVLCLIVLFGVLSTTRACDDGSTPPPPYTRTAPEPYPGAFAAAARVGTRGCRTMGPGAAPGGRRAALDQEMTERSYVPEGDWLPPGPMPIELETDVCGVVLAVADGGFITSTLVDGRYENPPCGGEHLAVGSCGPDPIRIEGQGNVHIRRYLMPGLTRADAEATPSTSEVVLAHAEAEVLLGTLGYVPADELVVDDLGPVPASHYHAARPPASPDEGCVLWVGVASGVGNASVTFSGPAGTGFMPANVSMDPAQSRATFALFACGASAGTIRGDSEASMYSVRATDAAIVYRAYAPPTATSPVTPGAPGASTVARARVVDVTHATLPTTVPFVHAEIE